MSIFSTVIFVLFFSEFCTSSFATELQLENIDDEFEALVSSGRVLEQTTSGSIVAQEDEIEEIDCAEAVIGADLRFGERRVLRTFTTANITLCCEGCQSMENCTTYRRNRSSGSCELFSVEETNFQLNSHSDFDIGGYIGTEFSTEFSTDFSAESFTESSDIPPPSPVPDCRINQGVTYPNGNVLTRGSSGSARHCCEVCRSSRDCNSWYYKRENNRCTLNRNIPSQVERDSSGFRGGTTLD